MCLARASGSTVVGWWDLSLAPCQNWGEVMSPRRRRVNSYALAFYTLARDIGSLAVLSHRAFRLAVAVLGCGFEVTEAARQSARRWVGGGTCYLLPGVRCCRFGTASNIGWIHVAVRKQKQTVVGFSCQSANIDPLILDVLKIVFNFVLGSHVPRRSRGKVRTAISLRKS